MLGHRLRRWPNIKSALGECIVCSLGFSFNVLTLAVKLLNIDRIIRFAEHPIWQFWSRSTDLFWTELIGGNRPNALLMWATYLAQQTRDVDPMVVQCWATGCAAGPTLNHHWVNDPCLLDSKGFQFTAAIHGWTSQLIVLWSVISGHSTAMARWRSNKPSGITMSKKRFSRDFLLLFWICD